MKRPFQVTVLGWLFIIVGILSTAYHLWKGPLGCLVAHSDDYNVARLHWRVERNVEPNGCAFISRRVATVDTAHGKAPILEVRVLQSRCEQMLPLGCEPEDLLSGCCRHNLREPQRASLVLAGWVQF